MLFMLKTRLAKPAGISNKGFYSLWKKESEAALAAVRAGEIKVIYKAAGPFDVITIVDLPSADDLDHAVVQPADLEARLLAYCDQTRNHAPATV
jgi:muconolactone delta-isomerase